MDRIEKIKVLAAEGKTLEEIGEIIGVSRERIRQLSVMYDFRTKKQISKYSDKEKVCKNCGEIRKFKTWVEKLHAGTYCSPECKEKFWAPRRKTVEQKREQNRIRAHNYYKKNSERIRELNRINRKKRDYIRLHENIRSTTNHFIKTGKLVKPTTCTWCPNTKKIMAVHNDWVDPMNVVFLCPACEPKHRKQNGKLEYKKRPEKRKGNKSFFGHIFGNKKSV